MSWIKVTKNVDPNDPIIKQLFDEAVAAAPPGYAKINSTRESHENAVAMLPRVPKDGRCRLCGKQGELTREHIPPEASGNKGRYTNLTFDDWLRDKLEPDPIAKHSIDQGGIFGYTLCSTCNSLTGSLYGSEYKEWVERAKKIIKGFGAGVILQLDRMVGPFGENIAFGSKEDGAVRPGAFVRQILSCMCSLSGSWDLTGRYPVLRRIILDKSTERLPDGLELGMFLYFGPRVRICGPQLVVSAKTGTWRWCQEIAFPPFAFQLILASNNKYPGLGLLIDNFTAVAPNVKQYFTGIIEMGFGWTPYPGDYRSRGNIIAARSKTI